MANKKIRYIKERKLNKKKFNENIWVVFLALYIILPSLIILMILPFDTNASINHIRIAVKWFLGGLLFEGLLWLILYLTSLNTKYKRVVIKEDD